MKKLAVFFTLLFVSLAGIAQKSAVSGASVPANYLVLQVEPAYALVFIDGQPQSVSEGIATSFLACGEHRYKVQAPGHAIAEGTVKVEPGDPVIKKVSLRPEQPNLFVSSAMPGTSIYVNDVYKGTDSWNGTLPAGTYRIEARMDGCKSYTEVLTIGTDETMSISLPKLQPLCGVIKVEYKPTGARVTIDGNYKGTSPLEVKDVEAGAHRVVVSADGYEPRTCDITMAYGRTNTIRGSLEKIKLPETTPASVQKTVAAETNTPAKTEKPKTKTESAKTKTETAKPKTETTKYTSEAAKTKTETTKTETTEAKSDARSKETPKERDKSVDGSESPAKTESGERSVHTSHTTVYRSVLPVSVNGVNFNMVLVDGGSFSMGATPEQGSDAEADEEPVHSVTLDSYYIGETEVTQDLWAAVMGYNPSAFKGGNMPVEEVSWDDCQEFVRRLNLFTGMDFRLPTEAEWEYAARGGKKSRGYRFGGGNDVNAAGWYLDNSSLKTHPVKTKAPNELGIYDMSGNVHEWCSDWYAPYTNEDAVNPAGPSSGSMKVCRGGNKSGGARSCRVCAREYGFPGSSSYNIGLRLVLGL